MMRHSDVADMSEISRMFDLKSWWTGKRKKPPFWAPLSAADHAFANGPVFRRPSSPSDALQMLGGNRDAAELLMSVFRQFDTKAVLGEGVRLGLNARLINLNARDKVSIGANSVIRGILRVEQAGQLSIGTHTYIGDNALISAAEIVEIGDGTLLAHAAQVFDNDSHPIDAEQRKAHFQAILGDKSGGAYTIASAPVRIGRLSWIGLNAIVMKGVTVGEEAIVAAGSVVTKDIESRTVVGGNPAVMVRRL